MGQELVLIHWFWIGLALLLIIFDILLGASFFLLWLGISAALVGAVVWIFSTLAWQYQIFIFACAASISMIGWHFYLKKYPTKTDRPTLNRRAEQYLGRTVSLTEPIVNGYGKIRLDDSTWRVEGKDLPAGTLVQIIGVDGVVLKVKPTTLSE